MTNDGMRIFKLEQALRQIQQLIAALQTKLGQVAQNQFSGGQTGGGGGGNTFPVLCSPTAVIAGATGPPATGTPGGPLAGQDVFQISGGVFTSAATSVNLYNGMQAAVVATKTCLCLPNSDGTYTVVSQSCV